MPDHGTRARYQGGCPCTPCKAANAQYQAQYRSQTAAGLPALGSLVSASRTHIVMKALRAEMTRTHLAVELGFGHHYARIQQAPRITLRTALKVQRRWRLSREGLDAPALPVAQQQITLATLNDLGRS